MSATFDYYKNEIHPDKLEDYRADGRPRIEQDKLLDALIREHGPEPRFDLAPELKR